MKLVLTVPAANEGQARTTAPRVIDDVLGNPSYDGTGGIKYNELSSRWNSIVDALDYSGLNLEEPQVRPRGRHRQVRRRPAGGLVDPPARAGDGVDQLDHVRGDEPCENPRGGALGCQPSPGDNHPQDQARHEHPAAAVRHKVHVPAAVAEVE